MTHKVRDTLYATETNAAVADFVFDDAVARVFPDMLDRSVPGYAELVRLIGLLAGSFLTPSSCGYDLGCSLGAVSASILTQNHLPGVRLIAIDQSPAMIARLHEVLAAPIAQGRLIPHCADIEQYPITDAKLCVLNLTLQFLPVERRLPLLSRLCHSLLPGGGLILTEKVCWDQPPFEQLMTRLHTDFKRSNGYSELEISRKRAALEQVLRPETPEQHEARLYAAGFVQVMRWFQCANFISWVAWN